MVGFERSDFGIDGHYRNNPYAQVFLQPGMNRFDAGLGLSVGFVECSEASSVPMKSLVFAGHIGRIEPNDFVHAL